jgi:hypothetical protein
MLTHVKCTRCGTAYNGKTGGSNATGITIYVLVGALIFFAIAFALTVGRALM